MADIIPEEDIGRLLSCTKKLIDQNQYPPVKIVKQIVEDENCSLAEAKEAYILVTKNETLGEYQERVVLPILENQEKE